LDRWPENATNRLSYQRVGFLRKLVSILLSEERPDEKTASENKRPFLGKIRGKIKLAVYGEEIRASEFDSVRFLDIFR
jgi:hypothetical protein